MIPTPQDLLLVEDKKWKRLSSLWMCPACSRSKNEIIKKVLEGKEIKLIGGIHKHHDHGGDHGLHRRFYPTNVCIACNTAEGAVKRKLGLPPFFSFAPWEIKRFIIATPHSSHVIDYEKAEQVFKDIYHKLEFKWCKINKTWIITQEESPVIKKIKKELSILFSVMKGGE